MPRKPKTSSHGARREGGGFVHTTVEVEGRTESRIVEMPAFEPKPWGDDAQLSIVGARVPRMDAVEKVTGRARYTADITRPGMLYAVILRAPIARGTVRTIDTSRALDMPGVLSVLALSDTARITAKGTRLFDREVRYAGQPVAAVCADSERAAWRAAHAIAVEYDIAPFAATFAAAVAPGAPHVRGNANRAPDSPVVISRGDIDAGLAAADIVLQREYRTPVALHTALEPHGAAAEWEGDRLTIWESTQGIFRVRADVAKALELPLSKVRVIKDYMGGGFGAKNSGRRAYVCRGALRERARPRGPLHERPRGRADGQRQSARHDAARHDRREERRHAHRDPPER